MKTEDRVRMKRIGGMILFSGWVLLLSGCGQESSGDASAVGENGVASSPSLDTSGVDEIFLASVEEINEQYGEGVTAYGDDPIAIAISSRYANGIRDITGRDVEALVFLKFLEEEDWSQGWLPEYEVLAGRADLATVSIAALGRMAFLPDNTMSDEIRERSIEQVARVATEFYDSWEVAAVASTALRLLVSERPHFEVTEEPYVSWLEAWDIDPRVSDFATRAIYVRYPEAHKVKPVPMPEGLSGPD